MTEVSELSPREESYFEEDSAQGAGMATDRAGAWDSNPQPLAGTCFRANSADSPDAISSQESSGIVAHWRSAHP